MDYEAQKAFEKIIKNPRTRALVDRAFGADVIIPEIEEIETED